MQWLRLYDEVLDDPKIQRLSAEIFRRWVNLLCLANKMKERGFLPHDEEIAFALRLSMKETHRTLAILQSAGLIDVDTDGRREMHGWQNRQKQSDDAATRMNMFRTKTELVQNKNRTTSEPRARATDTETDTESPPLPPPRGERARKKHAFARIRFKTSHAPEAFPISDALREWASKIAPRVDLDRETAAFLDHHRAKGSVFSDWDAAWRNWMRRAEDFNSRPMGADHAQISVPVPSSCSQTKIQEPLQIILRSDYSWVEIGKTMKHKNPHAWDTWWKPVIPISVGPGEIQLQVPNEYFVGFWEKYETMHPMPE